jgi:hypothetical protein
MKSSKPSSEEHRQQMISILNKSDLNELTMSVSKFKEYRKLMVDRDYANADDLYISIVASALIKSDRKAFQDDVVKHRKKMPGDNRGKQKTEEANKVKKWLYPLLAKCDAAIPQERKHRGWSTLKRTARQELRKNERKHPKHGDRRIKSVFRNRRECITEYRIQTWINIGRPAKAA